MSPTLFSLPLVGSGGEPIDFQRTINSHGLAGLPPASIDESGKTLHTALRVNGAPVHVTLREADGEIQITTSAKLHGPERVEIRVAIARMFRLDDDLAPFYAMISGDPQLQWAADGAGRMLASPTVFEDVIKTICTTNCAWSATIRMVGALVELGGGAFPSPQELAEASEEWYRDRARMGYRGAYVRAIAARVASGELDLERLLPRFALALDDVEEALLALPGIGPYGAAHVMQLLGRHERLVLDSWTRPTFLRLAGKKQAKDRTIVRAFARYGCYAGLAFWLFLTREWHS
ncbi:MAG: Fe-S cluster assembly protein HesB [Candidatus Baltobacteraceae bacterium]